MNSSLAMRPESGLTSREQWALMMEQAEILVKSGLLPSTINTAAKAAAIMLKGSELRIPPMYALSNINVINGKPTASAELLLALIYRDHGDEAVVFASTTDTESVIHYRRRAWRAAQEYRFTIQDAERAGVLANNPTWRKYTAAMLRARCISAVARLAFPDSIGGMYMPEELGAAATVDPTTGEIQYEMPPAGEVIEAGALAPPASVPLAPAAPPRPAPAPIPPAIRQQIEGAVAAMGWSGSDTTAFLQREYGATRFSDLTPEQLQAALANLKDLAAAVQGDQA